jgi:hypothetical protein
LTLGELAVESALGQPLSARVPVEIGPGEVLGAACLNAPSAAGTELGALPDPTFSLPEATRPGLYDLRITTSRTLYEPMYELNLQVRCPGNAVIVRQYVLMLDLPGTSQLQQEQGRSDTTAAAATVAPQATVNDGTTAVVPAAAARPQRAARPATPLPAGTAYRVQPGDTLSTIAARIKDRGGASIWQTADRIFASNPDAFVRGNPDLIKLGAEIMLPGPLTAPPVESSTMPAAIPAVTASLPVELRSTPETTVAAAPEAAAAAISDAAVSAGEPAPLATPVEIAVTTQAPEATTPVFQDEQAAVDARGTAPATEAASPAVAEPERDGSAPPWLAALVGVLLGAGASLLLLRERLTDALRRKHAPTRSAAQVTAAATTAGAAAATATAQPAPVGRTLAPREPSMVVVEGPRYASGGDPVAGADAAQPRTAVAPAQGAAELEPTSELASLFGEEPDVRLFDGDTGAVSADDTSLDLDLTAAASEVHVDQDIGWLDDVDETALTPTDKADALHGSGGDTVEQLDLNTMSQRALDEGQISDTLKEALELLEHDYEDELTASQVVDRAKLDEIVDASDQEDTLVRTGTDQIPRR